MSNKKLIGGVVAAVAVAAVGGFALFGLTGSGAEAHTLEVLSDLYTVDQEYRSMMGPSSTRTIQFPKSTPPKLVWVTGYSAEVVHADGEPAPQEFMCHSNLDFQPARHAQIHDLPIYHTGRLFTLSQGQQQIDFPDGFGLPFYTDETFSLTSQVLNLNPVDRPQNLRHKVNVEYVFEQDLKKPMTPLFMTSAWGLKLLEGESGHYGVETPDADAHGESCLPGEAAGPDRYEDAFNRQFSGHWVVEPGREVNKTLVTKIMNIPYDTTIHYISVHLHPFAESIELIDLTTGESLYTSKAEGYEDKIGLARVEYYSSEEGIPVFADHEYQLVSTYDNTTDQAQDSMAVMLLYLRDKRFLKKPRKWAEVKHVDEPVEMDDLRLVLDTAFGPIQIGLYRDVAPRHFDAIRRMADGGVYDGVPFYRIEPGFLVQTGYPASRSGEPLTPEQQSLIRQIPAEFSDLPFRRNTVAMALNDNADPNSAQASFFIMLEKARRLDQQFTVVGRVVAGTDAVRRMARTELVDGRPVEPILIERARMVTHQDLMAERRARWGKPKQ